MRISPAAMQLRARTKAEVRGLRLGAVRNFGRWRAGAVEADQSRHRAILNSARLT